VNDADWKAVAQATMHPIQVQIVELLDGHVRSPSDLARLMEREPANVAFHVRQLRSKGVLELVRERRHRGGLEHFYALRLGRRDARRAT
jgi:DNA-binding transcriptional ArsR family regulator